VPLRIIAEPAVSLRAGARLGPYEIQSPIGAGGMGEVYRMEYLPADDGKRFLMKIPVRGTGPPSITVVLNWPVQLRN
jgi:hypothetical protein